MKMLILLLLLAHKGFAKINVVVTIEPIAYLVDQIGKNNVKIDTLIKQGKDPHTFSPTPSQIKTLNNSDIFFHIGAPFESIVLDKINKNSTQIIGIDNGFVKRKMKNHHHKKGKNHNDSGLDPHIWLSKYAIKKMADNIEKTFMKLDPTNSINYKNNKKQFLKSLEITTIKVKETLKPFHSKEVLVFHPAFGYFLEENGLQQDTIELEGKSPSPKHIGKIILKAQKHDIKVIFIQPQYSKKAANTIAKAIKGTVKTINPIAKDILKNFIEMAKTISNAYNEKQNN